MIFSLGWHDYFRFCKQSVIARTGGPGTARRYENKILKSMDVDRGSEFR